MDIEVALPLIWHYYSDSNIDQIQELLDRGRNPNSRFYHGKTLLHKAADIPLDNIKVVRKLINAGADVNLRTHLDFTPLHFAAAHRKNRVVEALIQSGAFVNVKEFLGRTSLHVAVCSSILYPKIPFPPDSDVIGTLLNHKDIDRNAVDSNGETPLMLAIKSREMPAAILLLRNKANPNICNNVNETPLHAAFSLPRSHTEIQLLLSGANIYSVDKNGKTPLDIFLSNGLASRPYKWVFLLLKLIAFRYCVTSDLKQKFELVPELSQYFNKCCEEVDRMRGDFISGNLTMHDFCWNCFNEKHFRCLLQQVHKPVIERLVKGIYSVYFLEIFDMVPEFYLFSILAVTACLKIQLKSRGEMEQCLTELSDLFSSLDIIYMFSEYLSHIDLFCLIVAFSDTLYSKSMLHFHDCDSFYV